MKTLNKIFIVCLGLAVLLPGCANYYDELSNEDKTLIYKSYFEEIVNKVTDNSYYMYNINCDDNDLYYQVYNKLNYKQYVFMQDGTLDVFIIDVDAQYAYIQEKDKTIRTNVDESVLELLRGYEVDVQVSEFISIFNDEIGKLHTT